MTIELACATAAAIIVVAYVGYPLVLWVCAYLFGGHRSPPDCDAADPPPSTLLVVAHNEEKTIAARLENALMADYPPDRYHIVVASDGSTDRTNEIVRSFAPRGVTLRAFTTRRGKAAVLSELVPELSTEIVVLSDANTELAPEALRRLARWFHDPRVGVVCGKLVLIDSATGHNVDGLYWKYENWIKRKEAVLGGLMGANGGIYAVRRADGHLLPPGTIVDDFVLPLMIRKNRSTRIEYDDSARATEYTPEGLEAEFRRRIRIGRGDAQALGLLWGLLHPRYGWTAFAFGGHKLLRWACPVALVGLAVTSMLLTGAWFAVAVVAQATVHALAIMIAVRPDTGRAVPRVLRLLALFDLANIALLIGFTQWFLGFRSATWARTRA